jgi:electron transfer flavoprotein alpha subunit
VVILAKGAARQTTSFADARHGTVVQSRPVQAVPPAWLMSYETLEARRANPLEDAPLVFACGRGMGSQAACERLRVLAARYGAPLGFSRPAALNGWGKIDSIIGQSGLKLRAAICVAVGVSGAAAFMAGVDSAARLIAVNPDKNAPIFKYADEGIIAASAEFMAALEKC